MLFYILNCSLILFPAPNGQSIPCNVVQESSGFRVEYSPSEVGKYSLVRVYKQWTGPFQTARNNLLEKESDQDLLFVISSISFGRILIVSLLQSQPCICQNFLKSLWRLISFSQFVIEPNLKPGKPQ